MIRSLDLKRILKQMAEATVAWLPRIPVSRIQLGELDENGGIEATIKNRVVARAKVSLSGPRDAVAKQHAPDVPEIFDMWVDWRYRSRGVGSVMIEGLHRQLEQEGCRMCCVGVWDSNERAARFYERHGYELAESSHWVDKSLDASAEDEISGQPSKIYVKTLNSKTI